MRFCVHSSLIWLKQLWTIHMFRNGQNKAEWCQRPGSCCCSPSRRFSAACDTIDSWFLGFRQSRGSIFQQLVSRVSLGCSQGSENCFSSTNHFCPPALVNIKCHIRLRSCYLSSGNCQCLSKNHYLTVNGCSTVVFGLHNTHFQHSENGLTMQRDYNYYYCFCVLCFFSFSPVRLLENSSVLNCWWSFSRKKF